MSMPSITTTRSASAWSAAAAAAPVRPSSACADSNIRLVGVADAFRDRADSCLRHLRGNETIRNRVTVDNDHIFTGLNAYQQLLPNVDIVLLATPPGFRPIHIDAAIRAGKNVFTEKPVAVDGPGIRTVLAAYDMANQRRLSVVAGTQRRYQTSYRESMQRIHGGDIGTITSATCYWNQGGLWHRNRERNWSDVEFQIRNWLYYTWLSGDHICEQHVHNLDVINWRSAPPRASTAIRCAASAWAAARHAPARSSATSSTTSPSTSSTPTAYTCSAPAGSRTAAPAALPRRSPARAASGWRRAARMSLPTRQLHDHRRAAVDLLAPQRQSAV